MGLGFRLAEKTNTWLNFAYTDDLQETGSTKFLTDKRFFQFFEPRLLNIDLFHKHITKAVSLQHQISPKILSETKFSVSNVNPTYNYQYVFFNDVLREFNLSTLTLALQWSPLAILNTKRESWWRPKKSTLNLHFSLQIVLRMYLKAIFIFLS